MYQLNIILSVILILFHAFFYLVLPILIKNSILWSLCSISFILLTTTYWSLIHDCTHMSFNPEKKINFGFGRIMSIFFLSPFYLLRLGHLLHHRLNRTPIDTSEANSGKFYYYFRLSIGLFLQELSGNLLIFLPKKYIYQFAKKQGNNIPEIEKIILSNLKNRLMETNVTSTRIDAIFILLLIFITFWLYGEHWLILLASLTGRGFIVSVSDNSYHYNTKLNLAKSGRNLYLPRLGELLILNFNLHNVHHNYPNVPWWQLPVYFKKLNASYDLGYIKSALLQLTCPQFTYHVSIFSAAYCGNLCAKILCELHCRSADTA